MSRLRRRGADATDASTDAESVAAVATVGKLNFDLRRFVPRTSVGAWLARPMTSFHLMVSVAGLLTTLGLIMVLSAKK